MLDILIEIAKLAEKIYKAVALVKINHDQTLILQRRVYVVVEQVNKLQKIPIQSVYESALKVLLEILQDCLAFIQSFSEKKWWLKIFSSNSDYIKFKEFNRKLHQAIVDLNLGVSVQLLYQDVADRAA